MVAGARAEPVEASIEGTCRDGDGDAEAAPDDSGSGGVAAAVGAGGAWCSRRRLGGRGEVPATGTKTVLSITGPGTGADDRDGGARYGKMVSSKTTSRDTMTRREAKSKQR